MFCGGPRLWPGRLRWRISLQLRKKRKSPNVRKMPGIGCLKDVSSFSARIRHTGHGQAKRAGEQGVFSLRGRGVNGIWWPSLQGTILFFSFFRSGSSVYRCGNGRFWRQETFAASGGGRGGGRHLHTLFIIKDVDYLCNCENR